jgi:hypothetical protein
VAVLPGRADSVHLTDLPEPSQPQAVVTGAASRTFESFAEPAREDCLRRADDRLRRDLRADAGFAVS